MAERKLLVLAPRSGSRLRITDEGVNDAGVVYAYEQTFRPITIADDASIWATWQRFGVEIRHTGAVDLIFTPIVDGVDVAAEGGGVMSIADPGGERRSTVDVWFNTWGLKCWGRLVSNTLPSLFHIDGAWLEGAPQAGYRIVG